MKNKVAVGLMAMALGTASVALAQNAPVKQIAVESQATVSPEISALINEHPNLQALSDDQLRQRIQNLPAWREFLKDRRRLETGFAAQSRPRASYIDLIAQTKDALPKSARRPSLHRKLAAAGAAGLAEGHERLQ